MPVAAAVRVPRFRRGSRGGRISHPFCRRDAASPFWATYSWVTKTSTVMPWARASWCHAPVVGGERLGVVAASASSAPTSLKVCIGGIAGPTGDVEILVQLDSYCRRFCRLAAQDRLRATQHREPPRRRYLPERGDP